MFRVGGFVFYVIGQLFFYQMVDFYSVIVFYFVGYEVTRIYWSFRINNRRCCYRCFIGENNGRLEFVIKVIEQGLEDLVFIDVFFQGEYWVFEMIIWIWVSFFQNYIYDVKKRFLGFL